MEGNQFVSQPINWAFVIIAVVKGSRGSLLLAHSSKMGRYTFCIYCKLAVTISSYSFYFPTENSGHRRRTGETREQRRHGWSGTASSISNLARQVLKCREKERGGERRRRDHSWSAET